MSSRLPPPMPEVADLEEQPMRGRRRVGAARRAAWRREEAERRALEQAQEVWRPWSAEPVHTVADVAPLRWLQHVLDATADPSASGATGAATDAEQQQGEQEQRPEALAGPEPRQQQGQHGQQRRAAQRAAAALEAAQVEEGSDADAEAQPGEAQLSELSNDSDAGERRPSK